MASLIVVDYLWVFPVPFISW